MRRNGRASMTRLSVERSAVLGEHVHYLDRAGQWCVTRQPIGFLYARIPHGAAGQLFDLAPLIPGADAPSWVTHT
jgi:hypothetical protein